MVVQRGQGTVTLLLQIAGSKVASRQEGLRCSAHRRRPLTATLQSVSRTGIPAHTSWRCRPLSACQVTCPGFSNLHRFFVSLPRSQLTQLNSSHQRGCLLQIHKTQLHVLRWACQGWGCGDLGAPGPYGHSASSPAVRPPVILGFVSNSRGPPSWLFFSFLPPFFFSSLILGNCKV